MNQTEPYAVARPPPADPGVGGGDGSSAGAAGRTASLKATVDRGPAPARLRLPPRAIGSRAACGSPADGLRGPRNYMRAAKAVDLEARSGPDLPAEEGGK